MARGLSTEIEQLSQHKGISPEIVLSAVKDAMLAAARKFHQTEEDLVAEINPTTGAVDVYAVKTVTDLVANPTFEVSLSQARRVQPSARIGDEVRFPVPTASLGRIAAMQAKQVIFQKVREAERETICKQFEGRLGTMEYCTVKRSEGPDLIVELDRTEARMPRREQSRLETFAPGERVRIVIKAVEKAGRGPAVVASRASEELVKRLFEQEVPEIYDNTVEIKACAREAGERTKIAVRSRDRNVDAVGACVGMKGMRVQTIIREIRGEKIDIIEYIEDPLEMVRWALSPAKVTRVNVIDPETRHMEVIVDESQLSLAIGKKGQNVRLAAKLLNWRIDIKSEDQNRRDVEEAMAAISGSGTPVSILKNYGLSEGLIERLVEAGAATLETVADMTPEQLIEIPSVGPELVERIRTAVEQCYTRLARTVGAVQAVSEQQPATAAPVDSPDAEQGEEAAPVLPGEPESSTSEEEDDDVDFDVAELESFGKMNVYRGPDDGEGFAVDGQGYSEGDEALATAGAVAEAESAARVTADELVQEEKNDSHQ
ncbi:MAG: transcription termination/antitermination protein NusA [Acidobacteriia bacterium]|nr:transcription termination/antitermination protein NusA [Terriglobia bacterium]